MFSLYSLWGLVLLHVVLYTFLHSVEWRCSAAQRSAGTWVLSLQILLQPHCHLEGRVRNQFTHLLSPSTSLPNLACSFSWIEEMSLQKRLTLPFLIYPSYDICLSFSVALSLISVNVMLATVLFLTGRAESGFRHVEAEKYPPRLLHFKGKRVSTLTWEEDV